MRANRNSNNDLYQQRDGNNRNNQKGVQLPPIDARLPRQPRSSNQPSAVREDNNLPEEDKYEKMRNRSRNNAERLQKLRDIKSQYTRKNGDKLPPRRSSNNQANSNNSGSERVEPHQYNSKGKQNRRSDSPNPNHDFEIYEMEKVEDHSPNRQRQHTSTEDEIEALERELAQLKNDIKDQESSIAVIDDIKKQAIYATPTIDKNQVFGQRVKGKEINDYLNGGQDQKTAFRVQQVPGGQSQVNIGDNYNFFKDKENSNYINSKLGKQSANQRRAPEEQVSAGIYSSNGKNDLISNSQASPPQQQQKKHHPNEQTYNIINHNDSDQKSQLNPRQLQQRQQEIYSQQLREQIASKPTPQNNKNAQSVNIFEGYPSSNRGGSGKQEKQQPFISSLLHQQEKERNHPTPSYNNQATDITADGRKNVRVSQPPGGISQVTFF